MHVICILSTNKQFYTKEINKTKIVFMQKNNAFFISRENLDQNHGNEIYQSMIFGAPKKSKIIYEIHQNFR